MKRIALFALLLLASAASVMAQRATMRIDGQQRHQHITGFGAFVCSPSFQYNHMSAADIKKVWGASSTVGCNIMRLYIPVGKSSWSQSLATAKNAKSMGLIVFASPWGQPAEWKTNGTINAKNDDGTTGKLKKENWADYAQYLEDYVQYMRQNGVELDAISIQNEPDWPAQYAGCLWDASEIAEFVKTYGRTISCKVMAPETLAVSDSYANALNNSDVIDCFDIYGGHQYGGVQSAYKQLGAKGKELWMTEYLINWNENQQTSRNFDFKQDFFNFFQSINQCMLGDFNAWVHYAAKRYYGPLGDGTNGTSAGVVTKRGYVMAHFAKFVTGMTRIDATISGTGIEGSAYLSATGDTVVAVIANQAEANTDIVIDLPFYTAKGEQYITTGSFNLYNKALALSSETCRLTTTLAAQSVTTLLFVRSRDRQPSTMTGTTARFDRLDDMATTKTTFGTTYKMSGKTKTFDHSNPLISSRTNANYGYIKLSDKFVRLVMHVDKLTSSLNYNSSNTTLYYINSAGQAVSHNYGTIEYGRENFDLEFDLSAATLTDGCTGLLGLTCGNYSSALTFTFGDVYLVSSKSDAYRATLSGDYVEDDSYVMDYSSDPACTSIDMTAVTQLPATLPWLDGSNRVVYVAAGSQLAGDNVVAGTVCQSLVVSEQAGMFRPATPFNAVNASYTCTVNGSHIVTLPFEAQRPAGVVVYTLSADLKPTLATGLLPAGQPLLVLASGTVTFRGAGAVSYAPAPVTDTVLPIPVPGDVNGDGRYNHSDLQLLKAIVLGGSPDGMLSALADVNGDGQVNIADVVTFVGMLLK